MKKRVLPLLLILILLGCSKPIDTGKLRAAFASLDSAPRAQLETAFADIDAGKYKEAILPMRQVAMSVKLSKEQSVLLKDTMAQVQVKAASQ